MNHIHNVMVFLAVCKALSGPDAGIARDLFTPFLGARPNSAAFHKWDDYRATGIWVFE
jgi:hypothetical protein